MWDVLVETCLTTNCRRTSREPEKKEVDGSRTQHQCLIPDYQKTFPQFKCIAYLDSRRVIIYKCFTDFTRLMAITLAIQAYDEVYLSKIYF